MINEEQISQYAEDVQPLYFKALNHGIAAFSIAYPIEDRDDAVIEVRKVSKNLLNPSSVN